MKKCPKCGEIKDSVQFGKDKSRKEGLSYQCKSCQKMYRDKWNTLNKDKRRGYEEKRKDNPKRKQYLKTYMKSWMTEARKSNPYYRERGRYSAALHRLMFGREQVNWFLDVLSCSYEEFLHYLEGRFVVRYGILLEDVQDLSLHLDHIVPLSQGLSEKEFVNLWHFSNLEYIFADENLSKKDTLY